MIATGLRALALLSPTAGSISLAKRFAQSAIRAAGRACRPCAKPTCTRSALLVLPRSRRYRLTVPFDRADSFAALDQTVQGSNDQRTAPALVSTMGVTRLFASSPTASRSKLIRGRRRSPDRRRGRAPRNRGPASATVSRPIWISSSAPLQPVQVTECSVGRDQQDLGIAGRDERPSGRVDRNPSPSSLREKTGSGTSRTLISQPAIGAASMISAHRVSPRQNARRTLSLCEHPAHR